MSERERWVVYPLLFLTLGVSLRDEMIHPIADEVRCRRLTVCDKYGGIVAEIVPLELFIQGTDQAVHYGRLTLQDPFDNPAFSADYEGLVMRGDLKVFAGWNKPAVHIGAGEGGGMVQVFARRGNWNLALGQWEKFSGLLVQALGDQFQRVLVKATSPLEPLPHELGLEGLPPDPDADASK